MPPPRPVDARRLGGQFRQVARHLLAVLHPLVALHPLVVVHPLVVLHLLVVPPRSGAPS
ncbi:MAG: hypothetical protein QOK42_2205 [Frankiaceae bacterium]|nr:hypothetical protein [Frankiaceae bacterium]